MSPQTEKEVRQDASRRKLTGLPVSEDDLALLNNAVDRWDRFLRMLFSMPSKADISNEILERMSLEDADLYLDLKIQLAQCLKSTKDTGIEQKFVDICGEIRKSTYHHISTTLPNLADNNRSLMELAHNDDHVLANQDDNDMDWLASPALETSVEYKDCLVQERKQLKIEFVRKQARARVLFSDLRKEIESMFRVNPNPT